MMQTFFSKLDDDSGIGQKDNIAKSHDNNWTNHKCCIKETMLSVCKLWLKMQTYSYIAMIFYKYETS